ncbi:hypothetical protein GCM10027199_83540 [Amycolatopsis magusensis]|nr:GDSL-type esterase/lipase family protein [Amycolatopsis magusensis]
MQLTNVSCGGATIEHIADSGQQPLSPVDSPADGWAKVDPQIERAGLDETTDVVTIGVGGNTLGFAEILVRCVKDGLFGRYCLNHFEYEIGQRYERVLTEYEAMLEAVHDAAPNAKVITIGYPSVLPGKHVLILWCAAVGARLAPLCWRVRPIHVFMGVAPVARR